MFSPQIPSTFTTLDEMTEYTFRQLQNVSQEFNQMQNGGLAKVYAEPEKPREGMFVNADGTTWNPGAGAGIYVYHASTWKKIHA